MQNNACRSKSFLKIFIYNNLLYIFITFLIFFASFLNQKVYAACVTAPGWPGSGVYMCGPDGLGCRNGGSSSACPADKPHAWSRFELIDRYPNACNTGQPSYYDLHAYCCSVDDTPSGCDAGSGGPSPKASHVWVRVLSRDGPNGKPIAWKGNYINDPIWNGDPNPPHGTPNAWSVEEPDWGVGFKNYKAVETGPTKTWDLSRNKMDESMNFVTSNLTQPILWLTDPSEYWSNHFCIGSRPHAFDSSNPQQLQFQTVSEENRNYSGSYCKATNREDPWVCRQDVDGCWSHPYNGALDNFNVLKPMLDFAKNSPERGSTAWADLRYDEYWSLYFTAVSKIDTEFFLYPPAGYVCKDVRWFTGDGPEEESPGDEFDLTINADGTCKVDDFAVSGDGNFFIFEVEAKTVSVGGRVVNSKTGAGIPNISLSVERLDGNTNAYIDARSVTTDANGYYSLNGFIKTNDKYNVKVNTGSVNGYLGNAYAINSRQAWNSYIRRGYESIGYSWNHIKNPNVGNGSPWADTYVGEAAYLGQKPGVGDCAGSDDRSVSNRCWFAFDPPYTVSGKIVDYRDMQAIDLAPSESITVRVDRVDNTSNIIIESIRTVANRQSGEFTVSNFIRYSDRYSVAVETTRPTGYLGGAYAINYNHQPGFTVVRGSNIGYTWRHNPTFDLSGLDTRVGDITYANQKPGGYDCTGPNPSSGHNNTVNRCWFTYDIQPPPPTTNIYGTVRVNYSYPTLINPKDVRYDEFGSQYLVQFLKGSSGSVNNGTWQSANWVVRNNADCYANWPDKSSLPNCDSYVVSPSTYLFGEHFSARIRLPHNKYSCIWTLYGSGDQTNSLPIQRGWGQVDSANGETYCTVKTSNNNSFRVEDMVGKSGELMEGPIHVDFTLFYQSNRITGRVFNGTTGATIAPTVAGLQLKKFYSISNGSTPFFTPNTEFSGTTFAWPSIPNSNWAMGDYFKPGEKVGFSVTNTNNYYRCGWIFDGNPISNSLKSSFSEFGFDFNPENLATYPTESIYLKRGISDNCSEVSGNLELIIGPRSPLYNNHLYIFRLERKGRFSGSIEMTYDYLDGALNPQTRRVADTEVFGGLPFETTTYNTSTGVYGTWVDANRVYSGSICAAKYPNNLDTTSTGAAGMPSAGCTDFFVSPQEFAESDTANRAVARIRFNPGKYNCEWSLNGGARQPVYKYQSGGYEYCQTNPGFSVLSDSTGLYNLNTEWPTKVTFHLSFNENSIVNTVFDKASLSTAYTPVAYDLSHSVNGRIVNSGSQTYYITPFDNGDGFSSGLIRMRLDGINSNQVCYYMGQKTIPSDYVGKGAINIDTVATARDWNDIEPGFNPAKSPFTTFDSDCNDMLLSVESGTFSPAFHNQFYTFVAPRLRVGPSTITLVDGSDQCADSGSPITSRIDITLNGDGATYNTSTTTGSYNFESVGLNYNPGIYTIGFASTEIDLASYGICPPPLGPSSSNPIQFDLQTILPNYPNINDTDAIINGSIKFYKKDSNKWWQVYNGGVYTANSSLSLNSTSTGEGMPIEAVIVGDASANTSNFQYPNIHPNGAGYTGALVSPNSISPSSFDRYGLSPKDWGLLENEKKMGEMNLDRIYEIAKDEWKKVSSFSDAATDSDPDAILIEDSNVTVDSAITYDQDKNKFIMISDSSGNSTFRINANVNRHPFATDKAVLIVLVRGNVIIDPSVYGLRMVIYATGNISLPSAGRDLDDTFSNYGAFYSETGVNFERDLPDYPAYEKFPAVKVFYPAEIFNKMEDIGSVGFPSILTESKVFWVIED